LSSSRIVFEQACTFDIASAAANDDVMADGQHFVMVKEQSGQARVNIVLNWFDELKRLAPVAR
jgi:hypothetical protein